MTFFAFVLALMTRFADNNSISALENIAFPDTLETM